VARSAGNAELACRVGGTVTAVPRCAVSAATAGGGRVREAEVKYRVQDREALLVALAAHGIEPGPPVVQDDQAYAPTTWSYGDSRIGVPFVRLRTVDGRHTFTLKRPADNALSCDEHETAVADREQMHAAILAMGFRATVRIAKVRRSAELPDGVLCVDDVAGLGTFLELERIVGDGVPGEAVQAELAAFVAALGIAASRTEETYDSLVRAALTSA
jgi:adenylate cyclase, class 2